MTDRVDLFEAVMDSLPEGLAILHGDFEGSCEVVFWNHAAVSITGHSGVELVGRAIPDSLEALLGGSPIEDQPDQDSTKHPERGFLALIRHKFGQQVSVFVRNLVLRDDLGQRIGSAILFHPAEHLEALPCESDGDESVESSQADLEARLQDLLEDHVRGGPPFGVLWIRIDQAQGLRKTHGAGACETMLSKVEKTLAQGLRPAEFLGRWGHDEFLVISHERTRAMLASHAQKLAGVARTSDFRWWGDRISITVSIGAAQAETATTLSALLQKARSAMISSFDSGGNQITSAPGGDACLPS